MIKQIIKVQSIVKYKEKTTSETRLYVTSLTKDAKTLLNVVRSHWSIENSLHYVKDVSFYEDMNRIRTKQSPTIYSLLRSMAINLLNFNGYTNIKQARKIFSWNIHRLLSLKGI